MTDEKGTAEEKGIVDRAKEVAETLKEKVTTFVDDHEEQIDKAKDKTKEVAETIKEKVSGFVGDHEDQIDSAIDKTGEFVDEKTKGRYSEKIDKAQEKAKGTVAKISGGEPAEEPTATSSAPPDAEPTPTQSPPTEG